jgi:chromosomal replication initiator protein
LRNRQRTIIFAADRLQVDMVKISKDCRSRLQAGPIAAIEAPDTQLRRAILDAQATRRNMFLPPDVRDLIASKGNTSGRELEGALEQLNTYSQLTGQIVTEAVARTVLHMRGEIVSHNTTSSGISIANVLEATAKYYRLKADDLGSRQRTKVIAQARQLAMYLAREETDASLIQIGDALGGRDHSTVMHGCAKIAELLDSDSALAQDVSNIRQLLGCANENIDLIPQEQTQLEPRMTARKRIMWRA